MKKSKLFIDYKPFYDIFKGFPWFAAVFTFIFGTAFGIKISLEEGKIWLFLVAVVVSILVAAGVFSIFAVFISPIVLLTDSAIEMSDKTKDSNPQTNASRGNVTDNKVDVPPKNKAKKRNKVEEKCEVEEDYEVEKSATPKVTYVDIVCPRCGEELSLVKEYLEENKNEELHCPYCNQKLSLK